MPRFPMRNYFRFSLRTMFVSLTLASIPLIWLANERMQSERELVALKQLSITDMRSVPWHKTYFEEEQWWHPPLDALCGPRTEMLRIAGLSDPAPLAEFTTLKELTIRKSALSDLRSLPQLPRLERLHFEKVPVADLESLVDRENLQIVELDATNVTDLGPLVRLPALRGLLISGNSVPHLAPLAEMRLLHLLAVNLPTQLDLRPLMNHEQLKALLIGSNTLVDDQQVTDFRRAHPDCWVDISRPQPAQQVENLPH